MAQFTPNYNLGKPDATDQFSAFRQLFNDNMDKIDLISGGGGSGSGKIIKNQTLTFNNLVATISDADILSDSDFAVYYYDETAARNAGIVAVSSLGTITFTAQTVPQTTIVCDVVIFSASSGGASTIAALNDVSLSNLQNGQILKWNSTSEKWENSNESGGSGSVEYSTTEKVVGTWIDGSTLYQRTWTNTIPSWNAQISGCLIASGFTDFEDIIDIRGRYKAPNLKAYGTLNGLDVTAWRGDIHINTNGDILIYSENATNVNSLIGGTAYVTIQYTKSA